LNPENNARMTLTISVLTENNAGMNTGAEHGLSYFIDYDDRRILFDTGQSALFLNNADLMGIEMTRVSAILLSHGHFDHGNGLQYLIGGDLICHPGCFVKRYRKTDHSYIGLKNSQAELAERFNLITTSEPYSLSDRIIFLGEIPRITGFESKQTSFILDGGDPDFVLDDSAVALLTDKGLFVITGCGHSGIVNTLEHARRVTGEKKIYGIMGGFHLKQVDLQTKETIRYLKNQQVKNVFPSHCTGDPALALFYENFGKRQVKTGDVFTF
jgi:7,8-dihydropterin-6-yl-methyl-4-(beta-D-ribofuranosyl)aminobenzene 5'-phosphate synthase